MKSREDVEKLEKLIGQLNGLHAELSRLAGNSPNDELDLFKLKIVNTVLKTASEVLGRGYLPFDDFSQFTADDLPTNTDVTVILTQYINQAERFRSDNVICYADTWVYQVNGSPSDILARPPSKVGSRE
jgi:hypothetical protein